jgi:hypothetical protein
VQAEADQLAAWGKDTQNQVTNLPTGTNYTAIAGGDAQAYVLAADGSITAWGGDTFGEVSGTPAGTGFATIAAGNVNGYALAADGSITAWGDDASGQVTNAPTGTGFTAISGGLQHAYALAADGSIAAWGDNTNGQVSGTPTGTGHIAIAAGRTHGYALAADGSIVAWGSNFFNETSPIPPGTGFTTLTAGYYNGFALAPDGSITPWGDDFAGQVSSSPTGTGYTAISSGDFHIYALAADGSITAWAHNNFGQVTSTPTGTGYTAVAAGSNTGYALSPPPAPTGELALSVASCQDDADLSSGYQIEVELDMQNLVGTASGYAAFIVYDLSVFAYRGDLSSYTGTPFTLHINPALQADDGLLELDGSVGFGGPNTAGDALLATLVFDVLTPCNPASPINFYVIGPFASKLSLDGTEITTTLIDPTAFTLDDTDPVFDAFSNITQAADASLVDGCAGAVVTFTDPTATDNCSTPTVVSVPASGSFFATGTTQVTSTATDACGNSTDLLWDVTVTSTNMIHLEVELVGVDTPVSRCIRLQTDDCTISNFNLSFTDHDLSGATPVRAQVSLEIPCGEYLSLCTKDAQHTKWGTSTLSIVGPDYVADTLYSLDGGDTDDDGDVDIDDVTLFLAQFGTGPFAGGCPWDGTTRDTDFSNNGAIAAEDYVFLTSNWLTQSFCSCTIPSTAGGGFGDSKRVTNAMERRVDFDRNGRIDYRDVLVFETRNGLPHTLSSKMRGH